MGISASGTLATVILPDKEFLTEVPQGWNLEEAASIPVAYGTALYALFSVSNQMDCWLKVIVCYNIDKDMLRFVFLPNFAATDLIKSSSLLGSDMGSVYWFMVALVAWDKQRFT